MQAQFFKNFTVNGRTVLAVQHESNFNPIIQWFYQPEGYTTCSVTHEYEGDSVGFEKRREVFEQLEQEDAERVAKLFDTAVAEQNELANQLQAASHPDAVQARPLQESQETCNSEIERAITAIGLALESCHNCVATDLPEAEPDQTSWRIDNSAPLKQLKKLARRLDVSTESDP